MAEKSDLGSRIVNVTMKCSDVDMIEPLKVGEGPYGNELIFFIKPEIFLLPANYAKKSVDLILSKFAEFKVEIAGIYSINGSALEKHNIMARHYEIHKRSFKFCIKEGRRRKQAEDCRSIWTKGKI